MAAAKPIEPTQPIEPAEPIEVVTFDFWNTLIQEDTEARSRRVDAWLGLLEGEGVALTQEALTDAFAEGWEDFQRHWRENLRYDAADSVDFVVGRLGFDPAPSVRDELITALTDPPQEHYPVLTPNVEACLAELRDRGVRIGIICDVGLTPSRTLRNYLASHNVLGYFDYWSFSDEVGVFKPHAQIFHHALDGLGAPDVTRVAHVGDLRRTDVAGAKALGITSVRYAGIFDDPPDRREGEGTGIEADHVIADHADLLAALGLA